MEFFNNPIILGILVVIFIVGYVWLKNKNKGDK